MWKHWIKKRGVNKTAKDLGVTRQTIHNWLSDRIKVPEEKRIEIIKLSGYRFTMSDFSEPLEYPKYKRMLKGI